MRFSCINSTIKVNAETSYSTYKIVISQVQPRNYSRMTFNVWKKSTNTLEYFITYDTEFYVHCNTKTNTSKSTRCIKLWNLKIQDMIQYKQSKIIHCPVTGAKRLPSVLKKLVPVKNIHPHNYLKT